MCKSIFNRKSFARYGTLLSRKTFTPSKPDETLPDAAKGVIRKKFVGHNPLCLILPAYLILRVSVL
jgi:hypothetical protein